MHEFAVRVFVAFFNYLRMRGVVRTLYYTGFITALTEDTELTALTEDTERLTKRFIRTIFKNYLFEIEVCVPFSCVCVPI